MNTNEAVEFICNYQDDMTDDERAVLLDHLGTTVDAAANFLRTEITKHARALRQSLYRLQDATAIVQDRIKQSMKEGD